MCYGQPGTVTGLWQEIGTLREQLYEEFTHRPSRGYIREHNRRTRAHHLTNGFVSTVARACYSPPVGRGDSEMNRDELSNGMASRLSPKALTMSSRQGDRPIGTSVLDQDGTRLDLHRE